MPTLVIGVGNRYRGDDAVGPVVAEAVGVWSCSGVSMIVVEGDLSDLALRWRADQDVIIVDAMSSGRAPGTVVRIDALAEPLPTSDVQLSSHGIGLADAIELGRLMGRLPRTLTVCAVEAATFEQFEPMSPSVAAVIPRLVERLVEECSSTPKTRGTDPHSRSEQ